MKPLSAPSAPLRPRQSGRLRWPFAWLLACLLTAGMLALLAGVVGPPRLRDMPEPLQVALPATPKQPTAPPASVAPAPRLPAEQAKAGKPTRTPLATPAAAPFHLAATEARDQAQEAAPATPALAAAGGGKAEPALRHEGPAGAPAAVAVPPPTLAQRCPQQVKPAFPRGAREEGIERGRVVARLHLDGEGRVREVSILEASPRGVFEAATRAAARQWRCLPPAEAGETVRVPFEFGLAQ